MLPPPTINFGIITGGMAGSVVADRCELDFGLHYLPSDADADGLGKNVQAEVFEAIDLAVAGDKWLKENPPAIRLYQEGSGFEISPDNPLVKLLEISHQEVLGEKPIVRGCEYGSDARLINNYGKTPTILYGPGCIQQAHAINEFISLDEYYKSIEVFANTIAQWCNSQKN
jgi:acetylornithine deacetylase